MISDLSIVVPAYNEEASVAGTVERAREHLAPRVSGRLEWIPVDDGSTDGTWAQIERLSSSVPGVSPARHDARRGLGAAIWTGVGRATSEWCTWLPADGQIDPSALAEMIEAAGPTDAVMLMREEATRELDRRIITAVMYGLIRLSLGFDPYGFSGIFLVRRRLIEDLALLSATGVQNYAVVRHCQAKGHRPAQVRTAIHPRLSGSSKVANLPTMTKALVDIVGLRFKR